jgi:hypothetical protein
MTNVFLFNIKGIIFNNFNKWKYAAILQNADFKGTLPTFVRF